MEVTKEKVIENGLGILKMALDNDLPNKEEEDVMIAKFWDICQRTVGHIHLASGGESDEMRKFRKELDEDRMV